MANERLFWKTTTQARPSPMADGNQGSALGKSLPARGNATPTTEPMTIAQTADVGSICTPCVSRSATAFHILVAGGLKASRAVLVGTIRYQAGTIASVPKK